MIAFLTNIEQIGCSQYSFKQRLLQTYDKSRETIFSFVTGGTPPPLAKVLLPPPPPPSTVVIFLLKAVTLYGFLPHYEDCPLCARRFSIAGFWQQSGEIVCQKDAATGTPLSFDEIKVLRFWQHAAFALCEKVTVSSQVLDKFTVFLIAFLENEHGITLKSKTLVL